MITVFTMECLPGYDVQKRSLILSAGMEVCEKKTDDR
jgi:hypothetical protein